MNTLLFNQQKLRFTEADLPILIHGEDKSGASLYTISLAANIYLQNPQLLFLCGYTQAQEEFVKQVGNNSATFFVKEQVEDFKKTFSDFHDGVVIIKNIELFGKDVLDFIESQHKIVISGDVNQSPYKASILRKAFTTNILFSRLEGFDIPELEKYHGFLTARGLQGVTTLKIA